MTEHRFFVRNISLIGQFPLKLLLSCVPLLWGRTFITAFCKCCPTSNSPLIMWRRLPTSQNSLHLARGSANIFGAEESHSLYALDTLFIYYVSNRVGIRLIFYFPPLEFEGRKKKPTGAGKWTEWKATASGDWIYVSIAIEKTVYIYLQTVYITRCVCIAERLPAFRFQACGMASGLFIIVIIAFSFFLFPLLTYDRWLSVYLRATQAYILRDMFQCTHTRVPEEAVVGAHPGTHHKKI